MGGTKKTKIYSPKNKDSSWKFFDIDIFKKMNLFFEDEEITEEEIKNHYNVYVYKKLPYPPEKEESIFKKTNLSKLNN
jgi:hypothetical protein